MRKMFLMILRHVEDVFILLGVVCVMKYYIPVAILLLVACAVVIYSIFFISVKGKMRE